MVIFKRYISAKPHYKDTVEIAVRIKFDDPVLCSHGVGKPATRRDPGDNCIDAVQVEAKPGPQCAAKSLDRRALSIVGDCSYLPRAWPEVWTISSCSSCSSSSIAD